MSGNAGDAGIARVAKHLSFLSETKRPQRERPGYQLRDLMYELANMCGQYEESELHTYTMDEFDADTGNGEITVVAPGGGITRFRIRVTPVAD